MKAAELVARVALGVGRAMIRRLPDKLKKNLDDRFFYAIFQTTRVTNDAYGWTPPPAGSPPPDDDGGG